MDYRVKVKTIPAILLLLLCGSQYFYALPTVKTNSTIGSVRFLKLEYQNTQVDNVKTDTTITEAIKKEFGKYFKTVGIFLNTNKDGSATGETNQNWPRDFEKAKDLGDDGESHSGSGRDTLATVKSAAANKKNKEVFGFHPYWMGEEYENYNYKLLSSVSYFAYELNPETGNYKGYKRIEDWRTTPLITLAKDQGCKVYLTVTNFKKEDNKVFLNNTTAQTNSIRIIADLLVGREASGVVINFEDVPKVLKDQYTSYIIELSGQLKAQGMTVIITVPPIPNNSFNVKVLNNFVEYFIVMGKNDYDKQSKIAGPVAPLRSGSLWTSGSLENSIEAYLSLGIPDNKIILSLPYYGSKWKTVDSSIPSKKMNFEEYLKYKTIKKRYTKKPKYDSISETAYLNFIENGEHTQIWFDDARTLGKKYDFINEKGLAGVGIWALGYDNGHDELWEVLGQKFTVLDGVPEGEKTDSNPTEENWLSFLWDLQMLKAIFFFFMIIFLMGFLLSLRNMAIRVIVFQYVWIKMFVLLSLPALILIMTFFRKELWYGFFIFVGLLMGYYIYYLLNRTEELENNIRRIP